MKNARAEFEALTSLRGLAAMTVVFLHLATVWGPVFPMMPDWTWFQRFARHTYLCVDFFFMLSGFVIAHAYPTIDGVGSFLTFMRARFARIYPLHLVVLLIFVCLAALGIEQDLPNPPGSLLANLFLVQALGLFPRPTWNTPAWSISVEFWTYPLFPVLLAAGLGACGPRRNAVLVAGCVAGFTVFSIVLGDAGATVGLAWLRCALGFSLGVGLYGIYRSASIVVPAVLTPLVLLLLPWLFAVTASPWTDIVAFPVFGVLLLGAASGHRGWLSAPLLIRLGDVSYSIYLWHTLILHAFAIVAVRSTRFIGPEALASPGYALLCFVLFEIALVAWSVASYRFIEAPSRRWIRGSKTPAKAPAIAPDDGPSDAGATPHDLRPHSVEVQHR